MGLPNDFLTQVINLFVYPVLGALGLAVVAALTLYSRKWSHEQSQEHHRAIVEVAIQNGLSYAQQQLKNDDIKREDVQRKIVDRAYIYVTEHALESLEVRNVDVSTDAGRVMLREMIQSRFAPIMMAASASPSMMTVASAATLANPAIPTTPLKVD